MIKPTSQAVSVMATHAYNYRIILMFYFNFTHIVFENEQRKEIMKLKEKDHRDNYRRQNNLQNLYKQRLIDKLLEKKERAEKIKEQQARISSLYTKRDPLHL